MFNGHGNLNALHAAPPWPALPLLPDLISCIYICKGVGVSGVLYLFGPKEWYRWTGRIKAGELKETIGERNIGQILDSEAREGRAGLRLYGTCQNQRIAAAKFRDFLRRMPSCPGHYMQWLPRSQPYLSLSKRCLRVQCRRYARTVNTHTSTIILPKTDYELWPKHDSIRDKFLSKVVEDCYTWQVLCFLYPWSN